jgi:hypothetical protein
MSSLTFRRSRAALPRHALVIALLAVMSLSSCGGADKDGEQGDNRSEARTRPPSPTPTSSEHNAGPSDSTPVRITFGDIEGDLAAAKRLPEGTRVTIEPTG